MSILVTGGAGLLGAAVVQRLLSQGEQVTVIDLIDDPVRLAAERDHIDYVVGNMADKALLASTIAHSKPRTIYHLGAMLGSACDEDPTGAMQANVYGLFDLMEAAREHGVAQVIFASSVGTMGLDMPEPLMTDVTLQRPLSMYGITKLFGEGLGRFYQRVYGIDFRSIRYPSIVGLGTRPGGALTHTSDMITAAIAGEPYTVRVDESFRLSLLYSDDAARAMTELAAAPATSIKTMNYLIDGVKPQFTAGELAERVRAKFPGAQIDFQPVEAWKPVLDLMSIPMDDHCAREEWGWAPEFDYDKIIDRFIEQ
jgi:nucleoside-diphosphate-sugar epimerase